MKNKFIVVQREILNDSGITENKIILCIIFAGTDIHYPHPINKFLYEKFRKKNLANNTVKSYAEDLKGFLNYLIDVNDHFGIKDIRVQHAVNYLNILNDKINEGKNKEYTFRRKALVLEKFMKWLKEQGYLEEELHADEHIKVKVNDILLNVKTNMFKHPDYDLILAKENSGVALFGSETIHDFPENRIEYMKTFLEFALSIVPEIAFGIALQFFGGLRKGEVVNLNRAAFPSKITDELPYFFVVIEDRFAEIFKDKVNTVHEEVKVPRKQLVLNLGILYEIYTLHIKRIDNIQTDSTAMFISKKGKPICGQTYAKKFNQVKALFLDYMLIKDRNSYEYLNLNEWGSHFGRGVFTNFLLDDLNWNLDDVRLMRGDERIDTSLLYRDKIALLKKAKKVLDIIPQIMEQEDLDKIKNLTHILKK